MCHLNGNMYKTGKSVLMKLLKNKQTKKIAKQVIHLLYYDVIIIDGFVSLHLIIDFPNKFGNTSVMFLQICKSTRIDLNFDEYFSLSIKDY